MSLSKKTSGYLGKRLSSFAYAASGFRVFLQEEPNGRIHLVATILVVVAGFLFGINLVEWVLVVFAVGLVLTAEIFNTAIENIADFLTTETNDKIKRIKDLAAAGVLVSALTAFVIGVCVFLPKVRDMISG